MAAHECEPGISLANRSPIGYHPPAATIAARDAPALQACHSNSHRLHGLPCDGRAELEARDKDGRVFYLLPEGKALTGFWTWGKLPKARTRSSFYDESGFSNLFLIRFRRTFPASVD